ncbi:hypothetical protein [Desulfosporosinus sp. Sb-LF]|uniref:hypothetical protein n=1 Tax=Desulfosporosinus sp. Sb-LF TaxID=2560027 RepID=UPI00107F6E44|nr:hypothetical protein [Desulfosporosinus sp. Sb-LF]TGE32360.1 hypothetical protein E4K68_12215 [Desulfosporosinus sp. Sb-LF]
MNTYRPTQSSSYWMVALKLLILVLGLYLSALVLGKVFTWVFAIAFFLIRFIVFVGVSFIVLHFFLKLLFKIDLFQLVMGKRFTSR